MIKIMLQSPITGSERGILCWSLKIMDGQRVKDGHTTWLQVGAENGVPGMLFLLGFYFLTFKQCWRLTRPKSRATAELADVGRMTIASLIGFMVSAQFVTVYSVELPYYVAFNWSEP